MYIVHPNSFNREPVFGIWCQYWLWGELTTFSSLDSTVCISPPPLSITVVTQRKNDHPFNHKEKSNSPWFKTQSRLLVNVTGRRAMLPHLKFQVTRGQDYFCLGLFSLTWCCRVKQNHSHTQKMCDNLKYNRRAFRISLFLSTSEIFYFDNGASGSFMIKWRSMVPHAYWRNLH